jgi:allantoate deiminase
MDRIEVLARITDEPGRLTRTFASPAMRRANDQVAKWMAQAGMKTRKDAIGNLIGHRSFHSPRHANSREKVFLLGSHLDTVRNAGKFDGPLGVLLAIACVEELRRREVHLPFALEVVGFADEEGVRYQTAYLGSKVLAGAFDPRDLQRRDSQGIAMSEAIRRIGGNPQALTRARTNPDDVLGYFEAHIEQGPVLENRDAPVGIVTAIAGQSRLRVQFVGNSGHAGTVPMGARRDALAGAAEFVLVTERCGTLATVGILEVPDAASNVIAGSAHLTLDVRDASDSHRKRAVRRLRRRAAAIARRRDLKLVWTPVQETAAVACDKSLTRILARSVSRQDLELIKLPSGAGHDAAIMARITRTAMLFIRCAGGISHHPDESVRVRDVCVALEVMLDFIQELAR